MKRQKKQRKDSRESIVRSAKKHFSNMGFSGASTRSIAKDAGVPQGLIGYYFSSKEDLWRAVLTDLFEEARSDFSAADNRLGQLHQRRDNGEILSAEALVLWIEAFVTFCEKQPELHRIMILEGNFESERLNWLFTTYLNSLFNGVRSLIRQAQADGDVIIANPTLLYYTIIGVAGTSYNLQAEIHLADPMWDRQNSKEICDLICQMILTEKSKARLLTS